MLMLIDRRRSGRCLCFPLAKSSFELNFRAMDTACYSAIQVCLTHCVARTSFDNIPRREATSRSTHLLCELFHAVNMIFTKS